MAVEDSYRALLTQAESGRDLNLVFSSKASEENDLRRVNISNSLSGDFQSVINRVIEREVEEFIAYDPTYKLDKEQLGWLEIEAIPSVSDLVARVSAPEDLALFEDDPEFMTDLRFHAIVKDVKKGPNLAFFRQMSPTRQLKRSRFFGAVMSRGAFDSADDRLVLFDTEIDCFTDGVYMFIRNMKRFERIFDYLAQLQANAERIADEVLDVIPIENAEAFRDACITQVRFMSKLASIAVKPFFQKLDITSIKRVIKEHELDIKVVRRKGQERLVFDSSPARRWLILKLLDDDFLDSIMTGTRYSVNSKQPR